MVTFGDNQHAEDTKKSSNIPYHDVVDGYKRVYIYKVFQAVHLKFMYFYVPLIS